MTGRLWWLDKHAKDCNCRWCRRMEPAAAAPPPPHAPPLCPSGHILRPMGVTGSGWKCNGSEEPGGCLSGITGYHQTAGMPSFRCELCDYDLCEPCRASRQVSSGLAPVPSSGLESLPPLAVGALPVAKRPRLSKWDERAPGAPKTDSPLPNAVITSPTASLPAAQVAAVAALAAATSAASSVVGGGAPTAGAKAPCAVLAIKAPEPAEDQWSEIFTML